MAKRVEQVKEMLSYAALTGSCVDSSPELSALLDGFAHDCFSRMRSEGFSFNSGGLGVKPCSRPVVSAIAAVVNRSQPLSTACNCPR